MAPVGEVLDLITAFSRELEGHSTSMYTVTVIGMVLGVNAMRRRVAAIDSRQTECDKVSAVIQKDQEHVLRTLTRIEQTLERHDEHERQFWSEVRGFMRNGEGGRT